MKVSLTAAVGSISAMSVLSISIILVVLGYVLNSRMVDTLGREQAQGLGNIARAQVQNFFELPAKTIFSIQDRVQRPGFMIPGDDSSTTWYDIWEPVIDWPLFISNFSFLVSYAVLADDSTLRARIYDNKIMNHMYSPPHGPSHLRQIYLSNYSDVPHEYYYPFPFTDVNGSAFPATKAAKEIIGQTKGATFWRAFDAAVFPTEIIKTAFGVLTNNSGAFLGYMCIVTPYTQIDQFLTHAVKTIPGASAVVVDAQYRVVATSMFHDRPARWLVPNITDMYNTSTIVGTNCILPNPDDTTRTGACMKTVATYGFNPLTTAAGRFAPNMVVAGSSSVEEVKVDGSDYFIVVEGLKNSISTNFSLTLYLFYPRDHVMKDVESTQTLSMILSAVVAFVVVIAAALLTSLLVSPLKDLGRQMMLTARLSDTNDKTPATSVLKEVFDLQDAYVTMRTQLYQIREFLPQTLFEPKTRSSSNSDPDGALPGDLSQAAEEMPTTVPLRPLTVVVKEDVSLFGTAAISSQFSGAIPPQKTEIADAFLNEGLNEFVVRRMTVGVIELFTLPDNAIELANKTPTYMDMVVESCVRLGGVVEQMHPRMTIVTFNAHKPCVMHEERAVKFALRVAPAVWAAGGVIALDTAEHLVGSCGTMAARSRIHMGEGVDVCTKLTNLQWHYLRVSILLTERVAQALSTSVALIPIDQVRFCWSQPGRTTDLRLFAARSCTTTSDEALEGHRDAFEKMLAGDRAGALSCLSSSVVPPIATVTKRLEGRFTYLFENPDEPFRRKEIPCWESRGEFIAGTVAATSDNDDARSGEGSGEISSPHAPLEADRADPSVMETPGSGDDDNEFDVEAKLRKVLYDRKAAVAASNVATSAAAAEGAPKERSTSCVTDVSDAPSGCRGERHSSHPSQNNNHNVDIPLEITDLQGTKWLRARQSLGGRVASASSCGGADNVFRVLGPRGVLSAAKALQLSPEDDEGATRAMGETIQRLSTLRHDNIVAYHSFAVLQNHLILIMEFMAGGSERDVLNEFGALPVELTRRHFREIVRGLAFLHDHGVIHGELKPENIFLTQDGVCKLSDFGGTSFSAAATSGAIDATSAGAAHVFRNVAEAAYTSPEVAQGCAPTTASDVWTLGVILAELIAGAHPFGAAHFRGMGADTFVDMLMRNTFNVGAVLAKLKADEVPQMVLDIIGACLSYAPEKRPTAAEILSTPFCGL
jgi:serine/threonine protein kinase